MYFFACLVLYLVAEGSALVFVAGLIGWLGAIALIFLLSMVGGYLARQQGAQALVKTQETLARNESPDEEILHGLFIFLAGVLMFIPGFITDIAGLLLLTPPLRKILAPKLLAFLKSRVERGHYIKTYTVYDYQWRTPNSDDPGVIDLPSRQVTGKSSDSEPEQSNTEQGK